VLLRSRYKGSVIGTYSVQDLTIWNEVMFKPLLGHHTYVSNIRKEDRAESKVGVKKSRFKCRLLNVEGNKITKNTIFERTGNCFGYKEIATFMWSP
jgi:hypothetical protein